MKMQQLKYIKQLAVQSARYELDDGSENKVVLIVDYRNNKYMIKDSERVTNKRFGVEVQKLALGLLAREHGANLAKKEQYI